MKIYIFLLIFLLICLLLVGDVYECDDCTDASGQSAVAFYVTEGNTNMRSTFFLKYSFLFFFDCRKMLQLMELKQAMEAL